MQKGVVKGLPDCGFTCPSLEGPAARLEGLEVPMWGRQALDTPPLCRSWIPQPSRASGGPKSPPRTEQQGQKSHQKNVVLPAFHGEPEGEGGSARDPTGRQSGLHKAGLRRGGTCRILWGGAGFWNPGSGMQSRWAGRGGMDWSMCKRSVHPPGPGLGCMCPKPPWPERQC